MEATNRQKKMLQFFGVRFTPTISVGASGWEIGAIMENEVNRDRWRRYLYLTKDFDSDSPALAFFTEEDLQKTVIPDDWSASGEMQKFREEIAEGILSSGAPFDEPQPEIVFLRKRFMFTGKFDFGTRKECQAAIAMRGGYSPSQKMVSSEIDYLVIGSRGSKSWKRGAYGTKIEQAVLLRREHGCPAIISEEHWVEQASEEKS